MSRHFLSTPSYRLRRAKRSVAARFPWLLLVAGLVLLLTNLGNIYLWQDEAETALLSQRLGTYGLPLAFDGRNLVRQAPMDIQYTADYVWVYHPWLPFYWTALSFKLFGSTTFAARLPDALAGLGTVLLLYHSIRRHFRDQRLAMLSRPCCCSVSRFYCMCVNASIFPLLLCSPWLFWTPICACCVLTTPPRLTEGQTARRPAWPCPISFLLGSASFRATLVHSSLSLQHLDCTLFSAIPVGHK